MCKDGMRWQCSYPKCRAFCRMSSAGWLTPYQTNHEHPKPPDEEIRKRILRMELKARAQSSGATPGEIIRNALPAEEYQTTDQRACYTRCIQRFRKSLQRKNSKSKTDAWQGKNDEKNLQKLPTTDEDNTWKPVVPLTDPVIHETKHWHGNPGVPLGQMVDGKDLVQNKMELFGI
ncbi:hypothetical protein RUM44_009521 [Polyplax serrata]|uniref:Uncharacterized protein n=1 Tax=Polyplax serrata TaxID=468196 RepID=A0ABR1ASX0_POLSC